MYLFCIIYNGQVVLQRTFRYQRDIIRFTNNKITYNDFKKRKFPKKYRTYKDQFHIKKI
jgi:hypothetical protein